MEETVYYFFHVELPNVEFLALQNYIQVLGEGPENFLFDRTEAPASEGAVMQPMQGTT